MASDTFSRDSYAKKVLDDFEESTRSAPTQLVFRNRSAAPTPVKLSGKLTDQRIGIIGGGMAGLYAGLMLDSLGVTKYDILEANPDRVGGRAFTWYFNDKATNWKYVDLGAMRFPDIDIMERVIGKKPWSLVNYLNTTIKQRGLNDNPIQLIQYYMTDREGNNIRYYNSTRLRDKEMQYPDPLHFGISNGGGVPDKDVEGKYKETLLDPAFKMFMEAFQISFNDGWKKLSEYDHLSVRAYLGERASPATVEYLECVESGTGQYDNALTETVIDSYQILDDLKANWKCVEGGTSRLPEVMAELISENVKKGKKVTKIATRLGDKDVDVFVAGEKGPRTYDHVINTVPPGVLAMMDTTGCDFSYGKRTAVRALRVGSSVKIALLFETRWWQDPDPQKKYCNIRGGQSTTDLPIRTIVYPSYGIDDKEAPGVLLASYSWGQDATRLGCLAGIDDKALVELAISNIAAVHGVDVDAVRGQYTGEFYIQDWNHDEYSNGPFAHFGPGQFRQLFGSLISQEMNNRYHTAGEMASVYHAWIVGALNSAWRCVYEIIKDLDDKDKKEELYQKWGRVCEVPGVCEDEVPGVISVPVN